MKKRIAADRDGVRACGFAERSSRTGTMGNFLAKIIDN
jgi:hypothetical protein